MSGTVSSNHGNSGSGADNARIGTIESIHTVWHGYDVVLTKNSDPNRAKRVTHDDKHKPPEDKVVNNMKQKLNLRASMRRTSSGLSDDYGWLRQLDLRSEPPTIDEIRDWSFDVLQFEDSVLIDVFVQMLEYYDLMEKFQLDRQIMELYCGEVMARHHKDCYYQRIDIEKDGVEEECQPEILCEYHNWYHAISCAHVSFLFLTLGGADEYLSPLEQFCIIMGALIHDLDHPGTNNDFEVKRSTSLAKQYDNDAVLERHAVNMGLSLCEEKPEFDWLQSFDEKDREYVKHFITESVLATDPARHGEIVKEALAFAQKGPQNYQSTSASETLNSNGHSSSASPQMAYFNKNDPQHRLFIGRLTLHAADISNPVHTSFEVASDWAIRVTTEFSKQAKREKELQLPVTSFMDGLDSEVDIAKVQINFFRFMVKPLFNTIGILFPNLQMFEGWGEKNCDEYQKVIDER
mmetsp:Transcript_43901/g.92374  ORF Transcript_43901/g.92374 Transcript_43901/m.92374 type:complete len:463 (+) Transcript_43901:129-1517(+)